MRIAAGVEYKGTLFCGFEIQSENIRTVQQELESAISKVAGESVKIVVAGRTDSGVHAQGQVIHFDSTSQRTEHEWLLGVNSNLPEDISLIWVRLVLDDFHARYSASQRYYAYYIINRKARPALKADFAHWVYSPLDIEKMYQASRCLLGENDFSSFRAAECQSKTPMRFVSKIEINRQQDKILIEIAANAFLHHMVRNIVGSLILVGEGKREVSWLEQVFLAKDRKLAGPTAPACGLFLERVEYPAKFNI